MLAALFLLATPFEDASGMTLSNALSITQIAPDGAADDAGFRAADVLVHVDGKAVTNPSELTDVVKAKGGTKHHIVIKREGKTKLITLNLKAPVG